MTAAASLLDHADGVCRSCPAPDAPPLRLTARGQHLLAALLLLLTFGGLLAAYIIGQDLKCTRLGEQGLAQTHWYCEVDQ